MKPTTIFKSLVLLLLITGLSYSQLINTELKLKSDNSSDFNMSSQNKKLLEKRASLYQKPTKKIYFVPGGKIGMFFLQGDFNGNQMIALEAFGKYVGDGFWAEISIPFRFKTSPAFTDIGLDVNVMYPFLGSQNKSEIDPFVGGGLGLHFIGRDRDDPNKTTVSARGGLGLNLIAGAVFFRNYDFNIVLELKYFNYLREFDDMRYQGIGLNVGVTFPR
jgi:hypothetical protein